MRVCRQLAVLKHTACRRAVRLRRLVETYRPPLTPDQARLVSFVTMEALNLWASFSREFFISCVLGAKREGGGRVTSRTPVPTKTGAIAFACAMNRQNTSFEPLWRKPAILLSLLSAAGVSNIGQVQTAFSYQTTAFDQLYVARNFFAHRAEGTARKAARIARALGVPTDMKVPEILCTWLPLRPQNILSDWLDDFYNIIELLCW